MKAKKIKEALKAARKELIKAGSPEQATYAIESVLAQYEAHKDDSDVELATVIALVAEMAAAIGK